MRNYILLILTAMGLLNIVGIAMASNERWALIILYSLFILTALLMLFCTRHITRHSSTMTNKVRDELQASASELNAEMQQIIERLTKQSDQINSEFSNAKRCLDEQITSFRQENTVQAETAKRMVADIASQHGEEIEESIRANRIAVEAAKTSIVTRMRVFDERQSEPGVRPEDSHQDESVAD